MIQIKGAVQRQGPGRHAKPGQFHPAIGKALPLGVQGHVGAEKGGVGGQENRGRIAGQVGGEDPVALIGGQRHLPRQPRHIIGTQADIGHKIVNRAGACKAQFSRGRTGNTQQADGNTASALDCGQGQVQLAAILVKPGGQAKLPLGPSIRAQQVQRDGAAASRQLHRGGQLPLDRLPQHGWAQYDMAGRNVADVNRHRQIGHHKGPRLR